MLPAGALRVRGVLPASFLLPEVNRATPVDVPVPLAPGPVISIQGSGSQMLGLVARLRRGVTPERVETALNVTMARTSWRVAVVPLSQAMSARLHGLATGALGASVLVVLVCWTNIFSMAVTRGLYRRGEIATRTVVGATPRHIVRLLSGEGLTVAAFGGAGAVAVAWLALGLAVPLLPPQFATVGVPSLTARIGFLVVAVSLVGGASWVMASVLTWRLGATRQVHNSTGSDGRTIRIVRFLLVAGQLSAASVLLVGSALRGHSFLNVLSVDSGLDERTQTLTVMHDPNVPVALRRELAERTVAALRNSGGVAAAGASAGSLLDGRFNPSLVVTGGRVVFVDMTYVVGDYFDAMALPFVAGRPS